jgi:hypothetical protein
MGKSDVFGDNMAPTEIVYENSRIVINGKWWEVEMSFFFSSIPRSACKIRKKRQMTTQYVKEVSRLGSANKYFIYQ